MTISPTTSFIDALRYGAYLVNCRLTFFQNGVQVGAPYTAAVSAGTFTIDRNSEVRRTGQLTLEVIPTVPPQPLMPTSPSSLVSPFGTEVFVETGITATDPLTGLNNTTYVPSGLFVIASTDVDDTTIDLTITLGINDRSWTIAQRVLKNPYNFPATPSGNFVREIQALLNMVWSEQQNVQPLRYNIVPTNLTVPQASYDQGSDPWQAAVDMATAIGYELYFDAFGNVTGHAVPNPYTQQVTWNFTDNLALVTGLPGTGSGALLGSAYSTPVETQIQMTRDGVYNDMVIQGTGDANAATYTGDGLETSGPPTLGEPPDTNPQSPTFVHGPMGDVPNFVESSLVTGSAQAQTMAATELQVSLSSAWTCTISANPNPIFDIDNVITVTRERVGLINALVVLDTITHTIRYDDLMMLTGRILVNNYGS
jgi:hypothetical protein